CFWNAYAGNRKLSLPAELRHLVCRVLRVATAVIEEIADVVGFEYVQQTLVFSAALVQSFQLVAAGAERAGWRMPQCCDRGVAFDTGVDQFFPKCADNAVMPCKDSS